MISANIVVAIPVLPCGLNEVGIKWHPVLADVLPAPDFRGRQSSELLPLGRLQIEVFVHKPKRPVVVVFQSHFERRNPSIQVSGPAIPGVRCNRDTDTVKGRRRAVAPVGEVVGRRWNHVSMTMNGASGTQCHYHDKRTEPQ